MMAIFVPDCTYFLDYRFDGLEPFDARLKEMVNRPAARPPHGCHRRR